MLDGIAFQLNLTASATPDMEGMLCWSIPSAAMYLLVLCYRDGKMIHNDGFLQNLRAHVLVLVSEDTPCMDHNHMGVYSIAH